MRFHSPPLLLAIALLVVSSGARAAPPGVNLSWDDCGTAGVLNHDFACDTNAGSHSLVGSLVAPEEAELAETVGLNAYLRIDFASGIPNWWQLEGTGACRESGATPSFDFDGMASCENRWVAPPLGVLWGAMPGSPSVLLVTIGTVLDQSQRAPLTAGAEYYLFRLVINHDRTIGPGSCHGCQDSARITLYRAEVIRPLPYSDIYVYDASTRNYVLWQQGVVPVRPTSWSSIKQLYR